jgi:2'-5' RNA ligase
MSLRLFAAAPIPDEVAARLTPLQRGVNGAAWRPPENFHLTLRFFGEIDEDVAEDLDHELGEIRVAPFDIELAGAGWFGSAEPRVLWIGVKDSEPLAVLAGKCERAARRAGLAPETRKFAPHVTLAYCRGTTPEDAAKFAQRLGGFRAGPILVDRFHMYSSWNGKGPSLYVDEAEYPLLA